MMFFCLMVLETGIGLYTTSLPDVYKFIGDWKRSHQVWAGFTGKDDRIALVTADNSDKTESMMLVLLCWVRNTSCVAIAGIMGMGRATNYAQIMIHQSALTIAEQCDYGAGKEVNAIP